MRVEEALARADELFAVYENELRRDLPPGALVFDVHTHLGHDIDGMSGSRDELLGVLERYGVSQAFVFCMDEPDRHPRFRAPNDRTLEHAARSKGRFIPFVRLDLGEDPIGEAERCLDRGARGIKLHPRAQRFLLNDERLEPVFALAAERRVPILIHGGRGLPPIADHLHRLVDAHPAAQLIIAHAGIADLAGLAGHFAGRPNVFFDTSVWSAVDLLDLYRLVSPEQVLFASDYPYGQQPASLLIALRTARLSGLTDAQLRAMLGESARRIAEGEAALPLTPPRGESELRQSLTLARIHGYLAMATPLLWRREPDTVGVLGLALNACAAGNGGSSDVARIGELLSAARELWRRLPEVEDERDRFTMMRRTSRLVHLADILTVTSPD